MNANFLHSSAWRAQSTPRDTFFPISRQPSVLVPRTASYTDRFIPYRLCSSVFEALVKDEELLSHKAPVLLGEDSASCPSSETTATSSVYSSLLQMQILSEHNGDLESRIIPSVDTSTPKKKASINVLKYKSPRKRTIDVENQLNYSPLKQEKFQAPKVKPTRKIAHLPYKILDAPALVDDYYLNLLDWSSSNLVCIGLDSSVYVWSATTNKAYKIHEIFEGGSICSVSWNQRSTQLAVGESTGKLKLYDTETGKMVREMLGHSCRVGSVAWNGNVLSTGSRDRLVLTRDTRVAKHFVYKLGGHKQEICGLKWSMDENLLASGGNDNKLIVWNHKTQSEMSRFSDHTAAVKALAWSPHQHNVLASGGGKSDKTIKFWNMQTGKLMESVDTGSQVCNMMFSTNTNELLSTHGYSMNEICVWNYPTMQKLTTLTGHTSRVLYLGMSPDGENVVTGAGDETLRFWNVFPSKSNQNDDVFERCLLKPSSIDLR